MLSYLLFTLTLGGIYGLLALSLNLIWGGVGMVNLGLAGFFAVGAYVSALVAIAGVPLPLAMLLACVIGALAGVIATLQPFACAETTSPSSRSALRKWCAWSR